MYSMFFVLCSHFSVPDIPSLPGLPVFPGHVIHSHGYREPEVYKDQNVLVIGSAQSGKDVSLDLSCHAKRVFLCNRGPPKTCTFPANVEQLPGIAEIGGDGVVKFIDGQERFVESIILATGYIYSFPFLSDEAGIKVEIGKRVTPLYKHTINAMHPSLAFIGINFGFLPFPYYDYQVWWVLTVWAGDKNLPSIEEMIQDENDWYQSRLQAGLPPHKASHYLGLAQWDMIHLLADLSSRKRQSRVIEKLYAEVYEQRTKNLMGYKSKNYAVLTEDEWEEV